MFRLRIEAQVAIILGQGVEAVGAGGDDFFHAIALDGLDVLGGHGWYRYSLPSLRMGSPQHFSSLPRMPTLMPGGIAELDKAGGDLDVAFVEGGVAADEVENIDLAILGKSLDRQLCRPVSAGGEGQPERIAVDLGVVHGGHHLFARELPFHKHQVAAHLDDFVHVLDCAGQISWQARQVVQDQRASLVTVSIRLASGLLKATSPICLITFMGESGLSVLWAGQRSWQRLHLVQASVSKISFQVRSLICRRPETFDALVLHVDGDQCALGAKIGEEVVGSGGEDMAELGKGDGADKTDDQGRNAATRVPGGGLAGSLLPWWSKLWRNQQSHRRPDRQGRVWRQFGNCHPCSFDDESR